MTTHWMRISNAPKDREIDIWVTGPGSRRIADVRWGKPTKNVAPLSGCFDTREQWITRDGFAIDRRNGEPTHWMEKPSAPREWNTCDTCDGEGRYYNQAAGKFKLGCPECGVGLED